MPNPPVNKEISEARVNTGTLGEILGISWRQVNNLADEKIIRCVHKNPYRFVVSDSVQDYLEYKKSGASLEELTDKSRQEKANADIAEDKAKKYRMVVATLEGKMHEAQDVKRFTEEMAYAFRQAAIALPNQLAYPTAQAKTPAETENIIREEVNRMLADLSQYDYEKAAYIKASRDRAAIAIEEVKEELDEQE